MTAAFGDVRTIPASDEAKKLMKQLSAQGVVGEQRDLWQLGAAIGLQAGKTHSTTKRGTFQNINSLDPEGMFAAVMLARYPELSPEDRVKRLADHAEWGIREIKRKLDGGTLNWSTYAMP